MLKTLSKLSVISSLAVIIIVWSCKTPSLTSVRVIAELNIGESLDVQLTNGDIVKLSLLEIKEVRDTLRNAIRAAYVKVTIDGKEITLSTGNYNLPVIVGKVQIDCPVVKSYKGTAADDPWALLKDARFRLWPRKSPYVRPGTFLYPIKQDWLASMSQSGNEPTYVDWGENPVNKIIYYHAGHDIGGAEGMDEIVSATDGLVVSSNNEKLKGCDSVPLYVNPDAVNILDDQGWLLRYVHLNSTDPAIKPGARVKRGQRIGYIGKQGSSGGWVHLHFSIFTKETPSGKWGIEDAYAYVWESYVRQYNPNIIAVARPHHLVWIGQEATLDGRKSVSFAGDIISYEWTFTDGTTASGPVQKRVYEEPGEYSEILKVTDSKGNIDYDFAVVQAYDRKSPDIHIPTMQAAFHPTLKIKPNDPVTFLVRTFNSTGGNEVWDFGDGSPKVTVKSETVIYEERTKGKFAETVHCYLKPGNYVVSVDRWNESGYHAGSHLNVVINE